MLDLNNLSKEDELRILEEGVKTQFWAYFSAKLMQFGNTTIGAVMKQNVEGREWLAGKGSGHKEDLQYPGRRIKELKDFLAKQQSSVR